MKFKYLNLNPLGREVNDCTVRAIALATGRDWDSTYTELCQHAQKLGVMPDDVDYIDRYLEKNFEKWCGCKNKIRLTVKEFTERAPLGTFLITMQGHITCCIDGCIYDTFNPKNRVIWGIYKVK